jgi:putative hydrolase of the HAD superfamily
MIDTIIFDVGRVLVNWDYESYLKRFAFGPEKTKAIAAATFEGPYWRQEFSRRRRL